MQVKKLNSEQEREVAARNIKDECVGLLRESKNKQSVVRQDLPMTLQLALEKTGGDAKLLSMVLKMALEETGDEVFEKLHRKLLDKIFS